MENEGPQIWLAWAQVASALVTALATLALWYVTRALVGETRRMAAATAQPHVVATIEPNQWSLQHFDLRVSNAGNAVAYDVTVSISPPIELDGIVGRMPLQNISVLRPTQHLVSYVSDINRLKGKTFDIRVSWGRIANGEREERKYQIRMGDFEGLNTLGNRDALVQISEDVKKMREYFQRSLRQKQTIRADVFTAADRKLEAEERRSAREQRNAEEE